MKTRLGVMRTARCDNHLLQSHPSHPHHDSSMNEKYLIKLTKEEEIMKKKKCFFPKKNFLSNLMFHKNAVKNDSKKKFIIRMSEVFIG